MGSVRNWGEQAQDAHSGHAKPAVKDSDSTSQRVAPTVRISVLACIGALVAYI